MNNQEEVSFKDIIGQLKKLYKYLLSKWIIIIAAGIIGGLTGLLYAHYTKPKFHATLNFVLSTGSSSSSFAGLATQFGISLGNDNDNMFSGDNIITLMKSRRMVQQALFEKPKESDKSLINIFVEDNRLNERWQKSPRTKNAYPFPSDASKLTLIHDSLAREICRKIQDDLLDVSKADVKQSIYTVTTTSEDPMFAYYLTKYLVATTSSFYINTKTSVAKSNLDMLQREADSLRRILGGAITAAGAQTDYTFNLNPAFQIQRSGAQQSQARASALGEAYGQVLQNLELAKITLQKETPLYQIIDEPTLPLEEDKLGRIALIVIGGFIATVAVSLLLIILKLFKVF
ncbi:hypothetical protein [Parafilimonas sp.]|uniref:hypothetical protein n=1 Tax=Parafilimonas sp. TaxID=1969739 RepID=UPI0039E4BCEA